MAEPFDTLKSADFCLDILGIFCLSLGEKSMEVASDSRTEALLSMGRRTIKFPPFSGVQTCLVNAHQGHDKKKSSRELGKKKPNPRRARQSTQLAIAAKYFSIFSGYWRPGKR